MISLASIFSMFLFKMKGNKELIEEVIHVILPTSILIEGYCLFVVTIILALIYFLRKNLYPEISFYNTSILVVLGFSFL